MGSCFAFDRPWLAGWLYFRQVHGIWAGSECILSTVSPACNFNRLCLYLKSKMKKITCPIVYYEGRRAGSVWQAVWLYPIHCVCPRSTAAISLCTWYLVMFRLWACAGLHVHLFLWCLLLLFGLDLSANFVIWCACVLFLPVPFQKHLVWTGRLPDTSLSNFASFACNYVLQSFLPSTCCRPLFQHVKSAYLLLMVNYYGLHEWARNKVLCKHQSHSLPPPFPTTPASNCLGFWKHISCLWFWLKGSKMMQLFTSLAKAPSKMAN